MQKEKGLTLIEILVVIGILATLLFAVATFQVDVFTRSSILQDSLSAQQDIRSALKKMVAEIRSAGEANTGAFTIDTASTTEFIFYSDIDTDNIYERIRYFVAGSELRRGIIEPQGAPLTYDPGDEQESILVRDLVNATGTIFSYYDENFTGSESPLVAPFATSDVQVVEITLSVDHDVNRLPGPVTNKSQVVIRSLKDNF